jgi:hypothetical protein
VGYERYSGKAAAVYRLLKRLSSAHPIAAPSAFLVRGASEWLRGRHSRARKDWQRALSIASAMGMRYESALAGDALFGADARSGDSVVAVAGLPLLALATGRQREAHPQGRP